MVEFDQIVLPDEYVFEKVQEILKRLYVLKFKEDDRKFCFWMQVPDDRQIKCWLGLLIWTVESISEFRYSRLEEVRNMTIEIVICEIAI